MRKITRKGIIKKLDAECKRIVFKRDGSTCTICGSKNKPTWSHVFSRGTYSTRWDLENCFCHCWPCNFRHTHDQYPMFEWYKNTFGDEQLTELRRRFKTTKPWKDHELLALLEELKKQ